MFSNPRNKTEEIKSILFIVDPMLKFIWRDAEKMVNSNYPKKNIVAILKQRYNKGRRIIDECKSGR